ncbi:hypothetical protein VP01_3428g5 [Puccinia sorghi]|uniref:Uncharacterized protein n=1 Tax=Puccinia sorghi TaxID=27349 RepID=A0A0L6UWG2_9BASI|nr:hypothetical protein VP01_3428g5 [Puccinia sorghi]
MWEEHKGIGFRPHVLPTFPLPTHSTPNHPYQLGRSLAHPCALPFQKPPSSIQVINYSLCAIEHPKTKTKHVFRTRPKPSLRESDRSTQPSLPIKLKQSSLPQLASYPLWKLTPFCLPKNPHTSLLLFDSSSPTPTSQTTASSQVTLNTTCRSARISELEATGALLSASHPKPKRHNRECTPATPNKYDSQELDPDLHSDLIAAMKLSTALLSHSPDSLDFNINPRPSTPSQSPNGTMPITPLGHQLPPTPTPYSSNPKSISLNQQCPPTEQSVNRRARNARYCVNDIEFATEIGQSLLGNYTGCSLSLVSIFFPGFFLLSDPIYSPRLLLLRPNLSSNSVSSAPLMKGSAKMVQVYSDSTLSHHSLPVPNNVTATLPCRHSLQKVTMRDFQDALESLTGAVQFVKQHGASGSTDLSAAHSLVCGEDDFKSVSSPFLTSTLTT